MRRLGVLLLACMPLILAVAALAGLPPTRTQMILREANDPADLRKRLAAYIRETGDADPLGTGEAYFYLASSFSRGSLPDSAVACWRLALKTRNSSADRTALAEALLERRKPGDVDSAIALVEPVLTEARAMHDDALVELEALYGWAKFLSGDIATGKAQLEQIESSLAGSRTWRHRYAIALQASGDPIRTIQVLRPVAVECRGLDASVMKVMEDAAISLNQRDAWLKELNSQLVARDKIEDRAIARMQGRRVAFAGSDGFALAGVALVPPDAARHRAAVVMMAPGDTIVSYDSLAAGLQRGGFAVLLIYPRGSGHSVGPTCSLPDTWSGREEAMLRQLSRDARDGVRALGLVTKLDTTAVLLGGGGSISLSVARAAADDRRVRALLLLSPAPDPVDRGYLRATLARRPMPVFFQQTPEDFPNFEFTDMDYHATDQAASRVSDGHTFGRGPIAFRQDPKVTPRFLEWLSDAMKAPAKKATPPPAPRGG